MPIDNIAIYLSSYAKAIINTFELCEERGADRRMIISYLSSEIEKFEKLRETVEVALRELKEYREKLEIDE